MLLFDLPSLARRLVSARFGRRFHWPIWIGVLLTGLAALLAGAFAWRAQMRAVEAIRLELSLAQVQSSDAAIGTVIRKSDFAQRLPVALPSDKLLRHAFSTATRAGVMVVSAEPRDAVGAQPQDVPHAALVLRLTGPYGGIKTVLAELLARYPGLTVQQLRIQRGNAAAAGAHDATITLQQWLRPSAAALSGLARQGA